MVVDFERAVVVTLVEIASDKRTSPRGRIKAALMLFELCCAGCGPAVEWLKRPN
jgi:hypothetical protein